VDGTPNLRFRRRRIPCNDANSPTDANHERELSPSMRPD
jgi:hypothetical protein